MELLKRNIKWIIFVITLIIIVSGVSVYATSTYLASQVTYKDGKSVEDALNELYLNKIDNYTVLYDQRDSKTSKTYTYTTTQDYPLLLILACSVNDNTPSINISCTCSNYKEIISNISLQEVKAQSRTTISMVNDCPLGTVFTFSGWADATYKIIALH